MNIELNNISLNLKTKIMKALTHSVQKISITTGLVTSVALITYFLIMTFLGVPLFQFLYFAGCRVVCHQ
jgi:hypothetical protein